MPPGNEKPDLPGDPIASGVEGGIAWCTLMAPLYGAVNGYVHIPEGHRFEAMGYDEIMDRFKVHAHGGLTYARGGWIGFDTLHAGDWWPGEAEHWASRGYGVKGSCVGDIKWTPEMVETETRLLALQVARFRRRWWHRLIPQALLYPRGGQ